MKIISQPARLVLAALSLSLAGAVATVAQAAPDGFGMAMSPVARGDHGGPGDHAVMMGTMFGVMSARMLGRVNATPEQRTQIQQIVQIQAGEMAVQHEASRALRQQMMTLFAQPTVDANAVEALRQKQLAQHDANSKRMSMVMLEVSRVLTLEQRKQMADYMSQRGAMMQRHQRERQAVDAPKS